MISCIVSSDFVSIPSFFFIKILGNKYVVPKVSYFEIVILANKSHVLNIRMQEAAKFDRVATTKS